MIELNRDRLNFFFPQLDSQILERAHAWIDARIAGANSQERAKLPSSHKELYSKFDGYIRHARASVSFQRTLRIPDDGSDYPLPPGLGQFPVRHVDDFAGVGEHWKKRGGVMLPMHKTEALWLHFSSDYPMALKVGAGGICAVSGERWSATLLASPQNYVVLPDQPWLDGFRVSDGVIRQFVAAPLGKALTVEHQLTGEKSWGGLQLQVFPMKVATCPEGLLDWMLLSRWQNLTGTTPFSGISFSRPEEGPTYSRIAEAGLGAGGRMKQKITADPYGVEAWDNSQTSRCFVHLCLADDWQRLTGTPPPHEPPTAQDYARAGLPWFDYDSDQPAVAGTTALSGVKSVNTLVGEKTGLELPDNATVAPTNVVKLKPRKTDVVREF